MNHGRANAVDAKANPRSMCTLEREHAIACGSCLYPADWSRCQSCELVTHCMYAVEYLRNMKMKSSEKGCIFKDQLNGEESLYHALNFVNAQQQLLNTHGEKRYIKELREENAESRCLKR